MKTKRDRMRGSRRPTGMRIALSAGLCACATGFAGLGFPSAAHADDSGPTTSLSGYTASVEALGLQFAFDIPGLVPLPNQNLIEEDLPFARISVQNGPVVNSLGAPYYPGDLLANFGSLLSEFAPPSAPAFPNDPLLAEAEYPPAPGHGADESFGGTPPAGVPITPNVFSATSQADENGGSATATISDLQTSPPSSTSSSLVHLGPPTSGLAGLLGASASPLLDVGSVQSTDQVNLAQSTVTGTASTVLKAVDIAGVLDISQIDSSAESVSDGSQGTPTGTIHLLGVTVDGQPAYIDNQGVHVSKTSTSSTGVTPQQAQDSLDATLAQDGISVRLLDPQTNTTGAEGIANSGGLVVSFSHAFSVPYIPGEPTIPIPDLGNQGLPAGLYTATTSITLGLATSDVQAASAPGLGASGGIGLPSAVGGLGLGVGSLGGTIGASPGALSSLVASSPGPTSPAAGTQALGPSAPSSFPLGIPVPLGWLIVALVMCVVFSYPMLLAVRWQFLSGRGR